MICIGKTKCTSEKGLLTCLSKIAEDESLYYIIYIGLEFLGTVNRAMPFQFSELIVL